MTRKVKRAPKTSTKRTYKAKSIKSTATGVHIELPDYPPPASNSAEGITRTAGALVSTTREQQHGEKYDNHRRIADIWNGLLSAADKSPMTPLDAHDVANMMEALKIARRYSGQFNLDDYIDGAGYAAVAGEIKGKMEDMRDLMTAAAAGRP